MAALHDELARWMQSRAGQLLELHRRLVQVPSVNAGDGGPAGEDEVARVAGSFLTEAGIAWRLGEGSPGRANLLAAIGAAEPAGRTLLLMGHADVVPPGDLSGWRFPPFSAHVAEGRVWGRGANDCKMLVAAELFALAALQAAGAVRGACVRLAIGADEEAGGRWGFGWLAEHEPDFLRADLAINEGGGAFIGVSNDGAPMFTVACGEKGRYEVVFEAVGPGTHASVPWGRPNPLLRIAAFAERLAARTARPRRGAPIFEELPGQLGLKGADEISAFEETIQRAGAISPALRNSLLAQSRMTLVPTMITSGDKSNAVPTRAELRCDARILPLQSEAELRQEIEAALADFPDLKFRLEPTAAPSVSAWDAERRQLFERAIARTLDDDDPKPRPPGWTGAPPCVLPTWCAGFTDSRFVRALGTPVYGFQLVHPSADPDRLAIHCVDESIDVGMLLPCARALGHLALEFFEAAGS